MSFKSLVFLCLIVKLFCTEASVIPTQSSTNENHVTMDCVAPFDEVTTPGTIITSPNYPGNYDDGMNCQLTVRFAANEIVAITLDEFDVEDGSLCNYDYLTLYDGDTTSSRIIDKEFHHFEFHHSETIISRLCGYSARGKTFKSTGNVMTLFFKSDDSVTRPGFKIYANNGTSELANLQAEFLSEAKSGNVDKLKAIYQRSKSPYIVYDVINTQDREGYSALHWSIANRNIEAAEFIIQVGANVNTATKEKHTRGEGNTPLIVASGHGLISIVKKLVNNGARIDTKSKDGAHAAEAAALEGHLEVLKYLIQEEPQVVDLKGFKGRTPLIRAARNGHLNIVKFLLSHQEVDIDSQDNYGGSSLMAASLYNHTEVVEFLVQKGANIQLKRKSGSHAAYFAAQEGNLKILNFLVQNAPDVVDMKGYNGITPLGAAASNGHLDVVKYLISQPNVDIDSKENNGFTPLMFATYENQEKVVQILLQMGADKSIKDNFGKTALDYAKSKNFVNIIEILKQ